MVDAADLKSAGGDPVWVRIPPALQVGPCRRAFFVVMDLAEHVARFFHNYGAILAPGSPLLVALSGGPDSLVLLHLMAAAGAAPDDHPLHAAHLDHALRPESAGEAARVASMAEAYGVPCTVERVDVASLAQGSGLTVEEAGRRARYDFFGRLAAELGARAVTLAHNADDQVETILHHFIRGTGPAGLRGMAPVTRLTRDAEGQEPLFVLRPLLEVPRQAIEDYAAAQGLEPVQDPSNEELIYTRNRLRHELIPLLEKYNPAIREQLRQNAAILAAEDSYVADRAAAAWTRIRQEEDAGWLRLDLEAWRGLPLALQRRTLRHALRHLRGSLADTGFRTVEQARQVAAEGTVGAQAALPGGLTLTVGYESLLLALPGISAPTDLPQLPGDGPFALPVPGSVVLENGWELLAERLEGGPEDLAATDRWTAYLDAALLAEQPLWVRARLPGERFQPLGMEGRHARVKDVMSDSRLAANLRPRWPLVATDEHLLWIPGYHLDRRMRVTAETAAVVRLRCRRVPPQEADQPLPADH